MKIDFQRPFAVPPDARELILVRHGACDPPAPGGLIGGRSDPSLNASGRAQADAVCRRLQSMSFGPVLVTPLRRTTETAAPLGRPVEVVDELTEVYLGEWEGHGIATRGASGDADFLAVLAAQRWDGIPGSEPQEAFAERVRAGAERAADEAGEGVACLVVTHAGVIAELCRQITGSEGFAFLNLANGSMTRVMRGADRRWTLLSFNDAAHLDATLTPPPTPAATSATG